MSIATSSSTKSSTGPAVVVRSSNVASASIAQLNTISNRRSNTSIGELVRDARAQLVVGGEWNFVAPDTAEVESTSVGNQAVQEAEEVVLGIADRLRVRQQQRAHERARVVRCTTGFEIQ